MPNGKHAGVVYCLENICNGKKYIGSTVNFSNRKSVHLKQLRDGRHHSLFLQRAWNKYGEGCFKWFVVARVPSRKMLHVEEQKWLDRLRPYERNRGYNCSRNAHHSLSGRRKPRSDRHAINQGRTQAKLTDKQVNRIRERLDAGHKQLTIAKQYGVCQQTISNIARGRGLVYGGTSRSRHERKQRARITGAEREQVREMYSRDMTQMQIAEKTGYSQSVISNIVREQSLDSR